MLESRNATGELDVRTALEQAAKLNPAQTSQPGGFPALSGGMLPQRGDRQRRRPT